MTIWGRAYGFQRYGIGQAECLKGRVVNMTAHISKGTPTIIQTLPPITRMIVPSYIIVVWCGTHPLVPVQSLGYRVFSIWLGIRVPPSFIAKGMSFHQFTNRSVMHQADGGTILLHRVTLNAHLSNQFFLASIFGQGSGLRHAMSEWFLSINMDSALHRFHRHGCVHMIGGGYIHCVQFVPFFL